MRCILGQAFKPFLHTSLSPDVWHEDKKYTGDAYKIEVTGEGGPGRMSLEYERVDTDYITTLGSATSDREKAKMRFRYTLTKNISLNAGMLWFRDNLDGSKAYRTDSYQPEISFTFKNIFKRQNAILDLGYKYDRRYGGSEALGGPNQKDHIATFNYQDRFWEIDSNINLGYSFYRATSGSGQNTKEYTYNISLNSRHTLGDCVIKPSFYAEGASIRNELAYYTDQIYEYSFGLGMEIPKWNITSDFKIGQNWLDKGIPNTGTPGDNSAKTFGNLVVYFRPAMIAKYQGMLFMSAMVNDYRFSTQQNNFRENSITMGINFQY